MKRFFKHVCFNAKFSLALIAEQKKNSLKSQTSTNFHKKKSGKSVTKLPEAKTSKTNKTEKGYFT